MRETLDAYMKVDPAAKSRLEVLLLYPGLRALLFHRVAHTFYRSKFFFVARFFAEVGRFLSGVEIHPGAKIGKAVVIDHGFGVVIGETAEVGNHVLIYQGVTLGGVELVDAKRHPTVHDHVILGAGSKVIGPITIGEGARVGANAVVLTNVAPGTSVGGIPARVLSGAPGENKIKIENLKGELP